MAQVSRPRPGRLHPSRRVVFINRLGQTHGLDHAIPEQKQPGVTIRRVVHAKAASIAAPPPEQWSWVDNPRVVTVPVRYRASTRFRAAGTSNTLVRGVPRPIRKATSVQPRVTRQAGNAPSRPTVRNRLTSFGSRVPTLNPPSPNAEAQS